MSAASNGSAAQTAAVLWDAWSGGRLIDALPADATPATMADAYAVQAAMDGHAGKRVGWKLAATGAGGRKALGVDQPLAGPLYSQFQLEPGSDLAFGGLRMATIEAEFGLYLAGDLPADGGPYDRAAVVRAIGSFVPAMEVPNTRFSDHRSAGAVQLTADTALAGFFVLGEPVRTFDLESLPDHGMTLTTPAGEVHGTGSKVLGDPVEAVRWLANELASNGQGLRAGEFVITGAAAAMRDPGAGLVSAEFGELGQLSLTLS